MTAETRTEYAVKLTATRHGKWQTVIETFPDHATDRDWFEQFVADQRAWQADAGRTPDAELISRTITVSEWGTPAAPASGTPMTKGDLVWYEDEPHVITYAFTDGYYEVIPGDNPDAVVAYGLRRTFSADEVTARAVEQPA